MKTLDNFDFTGKKVLLRVDLNSDVINGKVIFGERIKQSALTIKELMKKKAGVVVVAHQGNIGKSDFVSLEQHSKFLNKYIKIKFVKDITGKKAIKEINNLKNGEAILLENIRFEEDEFHIEKGRKNKLFNLVNLIDIYINDAFSVCHREHFSIIGFPKYIKQKGIGRIFEREISALKKIKMKNSLYILGGAKPEDNIKLLNKKNKILTGGLFAHVCLISLGKDLGAQNKYLEKEKILNNDLKIKLRKKLNKNIIMPIDFAINVNGKRKEISINDLPTKYEILDIGRKTIDMYIKEIKRAQSVYMKGPIGFYQDKKFALGTFKVLEVISKSKEYSLIGGGHLNDAIEKSRIPKNKFDYISLSGGALLNYVAGERIPGIEALR